ncbi:MAG: MFS transporter [Candidatus Bathyarchaeia archaeon]
MNRLRFPSSFDRDLRLLTYSMGVRRIAMGFLGVLRSIYFALLGFSPVKIGILLSIATFVSAIHHITFGMLSDRFGRKKFLVLGGIFASLRFLIFAISQDFWMLALGQGIGAMGEGAGAGQPVVSGYIADKTGISERRVVFSAMAVTNALTTTLGSLMAGLPAIFEATLKLDVISAHVTIFWIGLVITCLSMVFLLWLEDVQPGIKMTSEEVVESDYNRDWRIIAKFSLVRSTSGVGLGFIQSLMDLYFFIRFGTGGEVLGPIYALARFMSMFSYALIPSVTERWGEIKPLVASRMITAGLALGFSMVNWYPLAVALLIGFRLMMMFTMPIRQSFATGLVNPRDTATAIGISNFARMSLRTIAPTVAGYMFEAISLSTPFISGAIFMVLNGILYRAWFQPREQK